MLIISWNVRPSLSFVRIKYQSRAEEEITLEEIPCLKCSIFGLNMLVYILNTVSLYFITRVAFLVIVRLKKDCIFCLQNTCNYYDGLWQYQAEFSNNHCNTINNTPEKKTYDNDISDSCWFNFATIIMENLTMIYLP